MQYTFTYQGSAEKFVSSLIYEIKGNIQDTYGSYSINEPNDGKEYTLSKHIPDIKRIGNGYPRELVWNASIKTYGELQPDVLSDGTIIMLPEILTATYPTAVTFKLKQSLDGTTTIVTSTYHSDVWKPFFEWLLQQCGESIWEPQAEQPANATSQPAQTEIKTVQPTSKHEVMYANKWLFEKVFSEGRNQKELVDEWLEIRKSKDFKEPPDNPLASMKTAISEERKRRSQL